MRCGLRVEGNDLPGRRELPSRSALSAARESCRSVTRPKIDARRHSGSAPRPRSQPHGVLSQMEVLRARSFACTLQTVAEHPCAFSREPSRRTQRDIMTKHGQGIEPDPHHTIRPITALDDHRVRRVCQLFPSPRAPPSLCFFLSGISPDDGKRPGAVLSEAVRNLLVCALGSSIKTCLAARPGH